MKDNLREDQEKVAYLDFVVPKLKINENENQRLTL